MIELIKAPKNPVSMVFDVRSNGKQVGWIRKEAQGSVHRGYLIKIHGAAWPAKIGRLDLKGGTSYKFFDTLPAAKKFVKNYFNEGE